MEGLGVISDLRLQPSWAITIKEKKIGTYKADFAYVQGGKQIYEDVKGIDTALSKFKRRYVEAMYDVEIQIT
jgi:hypothetical protein